MRIRRRAAATLLLFLITMICIMFCVPKGTLSMFDFVPPISPLLLVAVSRFQVGANGSKSYEARELQIVSLLWQQVGAKRAWKA